MKTRHSGAEAAGPGGDARRGASGDGTDDARVDAQQALARWRQWFDEVDQALGRQLNALEREREALRDDLEACGLATPQALRAAYDRLDGSERQALERQQQDPAAQAPAAVPGPRRARRRGFI